MKKLASAILFVGLAMNVSGQDQPKNDQPTSLKEAMDMAEAHWLIGTWEREGSDGSSRQLSLKWTIKDAVISVHSSGGRLENHGIIGFDPTSGKVIGKGFARRGVIDTEWLSADGKLIEKVTWSAKWEGELRQFSYARSYRKVDDNTVEATFHGVTETGEIGEVRKREDGTPVTQTWKRAKFQAIPPISPSANR